MNVFGFLRLPESPLPSSPIALWSRLTVVVWLVLLVGLYGVVAILIGWLAFAGRDERWRAGHRSRSGPVRHGPGAVAHQGLRGSSGRGDGVGTALDAVFAADWVAALPSGLDTVVGAHARDLTAGQQQQVALARVLLKDPSVAILDEATAESSSKAPTTSSSPKAANTLVSGTHGRPTAEVLWMSIWRSTVRRCVEGRQWVGPLSTQEQPE